ncbi:LOW QUALITY PROTEIN: trypsin CFT-1-like [Leguminivora glycinivorella]|uniref:LOW QUALITY PROTEIN: trypsin CFT-1-like n=1 Tax=Leguminivora glycinivorella TaxID=1035111 RepID=UPI00200E8E79|nr:LOW QUALITY PROTEIN: trypsin CFT-1-like [Leguminivora glycinivorella]
MLDGDNKSFKNKIVEGEATTIDRYPFQVALLESDTLEWFNQRWGGTILNQRSILSAAYCFWPWPSPPAAFYRVRVGSSFANRGGVVHNAARIIAHPFYNPSTQDNDIAIVRLATRITFNINTQPGPIAGANYNLADNEVVWASGWGLLRDDSQHEQLRHIQVLVINQTTRVCRHRHRDPGSEFITDNMLCSGLLDMDARDQCAQDLGGPLTHNGVVVGVCLMEQVCGDPWYPAVNVRVSRYTSWIQATA